MDHGLYMNRCFQLAALGSGKVAPNPLVGAVLVHGETVIAEGFHKKFGGAHAEVEALNQVTDPEILRNATLYVNLEPCSHTGKTPPCTDLIISKGIRKVVISNEDPFPLVNGSGIRQLQNAGVSITQNVLDKEGEILNRRFFTYHNQQRPYIILKWAKTKNGFIAPLHTAGQSKQKWISNPLSRSLVHLWRSEEQAILVGKGTVTSDNPRLNVRGITGSDPVRIIIDPKLSLSGNYHVFNKKVKTIIFNTVKSFSKGNLIYIRIDEGPLFMQSVLTELYKENIQSVLVEGGAFTLNAFLQRNLWDEARVFTGTIDFADGIPGPEISGILAEQHDIEGDLLNIYYNRIRL